MGLSLIVMWLNQCNKPPMTGNGFTPYKNGDDWGMDYWFNHINGIIDNSNANKIVSCDYK